MKKKKTSTNNNEFKKYSSIINITAVVGWSNELCLIQVEKYWLHKKTEHI